MSLKHAFQSVVADDASQPTLVQPQRDWNADHVIAGGNLGSLVYQGASGAPTQLNSVAVGQVLTSTGAAAAPAWSASPVLTAVKTAANGLQTLDTNASHYLGITAGSDLTADRILTLVTGDAARTVTLSGNPTLNDWFDQSVKVAASPTFAAVVAGYFSGTGVVAGAGVARFANNTSVAWRNQANSGNVTLTVNTSDVFDFAAAVSVTGSITSSSRIDAGTVMTCTAIGVNTAAPAVGYLQVQTGVIVGSTTLVESELSVLDGVVAGTVTASKTVVVDANKDIGSFRNVTVTGYVSTPQLGSGSPVVGIGGVTGSFPAIVRNGTIAEFKLADLSAWAPVHAKLFSSTEEVTVGTSLYVGTFATFGTNYASGGTLRLAHGAEAYGRNNANSGNRSIFNWGQAATDELILGDANNVVQLRTSGAVPSALTNGSWWVECTGTSPTRVCAIKVYDGGATRTIASTMY